MLRPVLRHHRALGYGVQPTETGGVFIYSLETGYPAASQASIPPAKYKTLVYHQATAIALALADL